MPPTRNPYRAVFATLARRRPERWRWWLPVLASVAAMPLARPVLLSFLTQGAGIAWVAGLEAVTVRLGALMAAAMALHTYSDLVRSPDRPVLDAHPVEPKALLRAIAWRTARQRSYLPVMAAVLLAPVLQVVGWVPWLGAVGVVLGAWLSALGVGFAVHLGAVWAGLSPGLAKVLDAVRGDNPRMQAALIYAPGAALLVVAISVVFSSAGLSHALTGAPSGWAFLCIPPLLGLVGWALAGPLAERYYVRATALLTEVDGLVSGVSSAEEDRTVYLEWMARGRPELLRQLRQGWRSYRPWALGGWGLGFLGLLAAWSGESGTEGRLLSVVGGCMLLFSLLPPQLSKGDPPWLDEALGTRPGPVDNARFVVALLYAQGALVLPLAGGLVRHGAVVLPPLVAVEGVAALLIFVSAKLARRLGERAAWMVGPLALVVWAGLTFSATPDLGIWLQAGAP
jgi:hypothetical protein